MKTNTKTSNARLIHAYVQHLREASGKDEKSIDEALKAINRYEQVTGGRYFGKFHYQQAVKFKQALLEQQTARGEGKLSASTVYSTLRHVHQFFEWLSKEPGFRLAIKHNDLNYFTLSEKLSRIAKTSIERRPPTIEEVHQLLASMPVGSEVGMRDRAVIAALLLTGARDQALVSLKLKHLDFKEGCLTQDPREVDTKFSKLIHTFFFPVGGNVLQIVVEWVDYLVSKKGFGLNDPLFPITRPDYESGNGLEWDALDRKHWLSTNPVRRILMAACAQAELPYFNPHSFRKTLTRLGMDICKTPEDFKAWSQNLGHEGVLTTFTSYGKLDPYRQGQLLKKLHSPVSTAIDRQD